MVEVLLFSASSFLVGLSGALVPGPMLTVTISNSLHKGPMAGPMVVSGHIIAEVAILMLLLLGLGWLIGSATATLLIGTVGGLVLVYMGYRISQSSPPRFQGKVKAPDKYGSVLGGILSSISNPYFFIWWVTIGWAFVLKGLEFAGLAGILGFMAGHWAADLGFYSLVSFFTSKGSDILTQKYYRALMYGCGIFMICLGIYFVFSAQIGSL
ncbi:LysE family translocator [Methanobacterium sp. CWC-01]|uniref:LysE family translocator n=1 Tax=Methanobacterium aridiramus TaxID=2584467 RepID=UPI002575CF78|nr:LysE family transporter [Methanobacterium sp. CWC-01]